LSDGVVRFKLPSWSGGVAEGRGGCLLFLHKPARK
jgi:hypothetical protein